MTYNDVVKNIDSNEKQKTVETSKQTTRKSPLIDSRILAEMVLMIALAVSLHLVRPIILPQGGSITMGSMIPILLFALRRGPKLGISSGVIFGIIVVIIEPWIVHPVQFLLDYPIAFGSLGLAGFFRRWSIIGVGIGIAGRFVSHFMAGIVFFADYAPEGIHPAVYSLIYNGSFLSVEFIVSGIAIWILLKRRILDVFR